MVFLGPTCYTRAHFERFGVMDGVKVQLG
ncbi:MAG: hypothetical protein QOC89_4207, partial [Paraburkholderia sp.]|nr:hypothetical protein [Paraburkholderia sp.]